MKLEKDIKVAVLLFSGFLAGCAHRPPLSPPAPPPPPPLERTTVRDFLVSGQVERPGFGLYSYLLMTQKPLAQDLSMQARWRAVVSAVLSLPASPSGPEVLTAADRICLNNTYLPVSAAPLNGNSVSIDWVLDHYDYTRAALLAAKFNSESHQLGPYIVSVESPLTAIQRLEAQSDHYFYMDLSSSEPNIASTAVLNFKKQVAQPRYWQGSWSSTIRLAILNAISELAAVLPLIHSH